MLTRLVGKATEIGTDVLRKRIRPSQDTGHAGWQSSLEEILLGGGNEAVWNQAKSYNSRRSSENTFWKKSFEEVRNDTTSFSKKKNV